MIYRTAIGSILLLLGILPSCTQDSMVGKGGSSETVNAQLIIQDSAVSLTIPDNQAETVELQPFAPTYRPYEHTGYAGAPVTASGNALIWTAPTTGMYNFLLSIPQKQMSGLLENVELRQGITDTFFCALGLSHTITGVITSADRSAGPQQYALSIYGTPFYAVSVNNGFRIDNVPDGQFTLRVRSTAKKLFITTSAYSISTKAFEPSTRLDVVIP